MISFILGVVFTLFGLTAFMAVLGGKTREVSELEDWPVRGKETRETKQ